MKIITGINLGKRFCEDWKEFSFGVAKGRLVRDLSILQWEKRKEYYERRVLTYLDKHYGRVIKKAIDEQATDETGAPSTFVWVMWWQGVDAMPDIVRACWEQLNRAIHVPWKLILITEKNYKDYIELPQCIENKFQDGFITLTHLSDIIRANLLKKFGGFWIDATMYVGGISEEMFQREFYTLHAPGLFPNFVSRGDWAPFFIYVRNPNHPLFCALEVFFIEYWRNHQALIDYLMIDFAIMLILHCHPKIEYQISSIPENREYYSLNLAINDRYSTEKAQSMLRKSIVQKLTYKKEFLMTDEEGFATNYQKLITGSFGDENK